MKYQIYIEDSAVEDLAELEGETSPVVIEAGYLEKKAIEADNIEKAVQIAHDWAANFSSDVLDWVTVIVEEIGTGQHRHFKVWVRYDDEEGGDRGPFETSCSNYFAGLAKAFSRRATFLAIPRLNSSPSSPK